MSLTKPFDVSFFGGLLFVVAAVAIAVAAINDHGLPIFGTGRGALIAVLLVGMSGCAIAGVSQATPLGWTHPLIITGSALGVVALAVIGAGLFGWDAVVRPVATLVPGGTFVAATTEQLALVAIAGLIVIKFLINLGFAITHLTS
jgi:hypothetical protein